MLCTDSNPTSFLYILIFENNGDAFSKKRPEDHVID